MQLKKIYIIFFLIILIYSCSPKKEEVSVIKNKDLEGQMIETYDEAMDAFNKGDVLLAGKKFNEVELLYPQSIWAPKANLMAAYGYFSQSYYSDAINELDNLFAPSIFTLSILNSSA